MFSCVSQRMRLLGYLCVYEIDRTRLFLDKKNINCLVIMICVCVCVCVCVCRLSWRPLKNGRKAGERKIGGTRRRSPRRGHGFNTGSTLWCLCVALSWLLRPSTYCRSTRTACLPPMPPDHHHRRRGEQTVLWACTATALNRPSGPLLRD